MRPLKNSRDSARGLRSLCLHETNPSLLDARKGEEMNSQAVRDFVMSAASGDVPRMLDAIYDGGLDYREGWPRAMRAVSRFKSVPSSIRETFLRVYIREGDHIRLQCDDLALADGLRVLLPRYRGPARRLYRGESFRNRCRRTYGLSWSASRDVARQFANRYYRSSDGGSVLLEGFASRSAIICAPALIDDRYGEEEFIVDRRRLSAVRVAERFAQDAAA